MCTVRGIGTTDRANGRLRGVGEVKIFMGNHEWRDSWFRKQKQKEESHRVEYFRKRSRWSVSGKNNGEKHD